MTVSDQLDELRVALPGCSLVVFGDLFSRITLCASAKGKYPQEQLDALCVTAGNLLNGPPARSAIPVLGMQGENDLGRAIILSPEGMQIFLRSPVEDADVLCCVCSLDADMETATAMAQSTLNQIAQDP
jgi:hypothetical protein